MSTPPACQVSVFICMAAGHIVIGQRLFVVWIFRDILYGRNHTVTVVCVKKTGFKMTVTFGKVIVKKECNQKNTAITLGNFYR